MQLRLPTAAGVALCTMTAPAEAGGCFPALAGFCTAYEFHGVMFSWPLCHSLDDTVCLPPFRGRMSLCLWAL